MDNELFHEQIPVTTIDVVPPTPLYKRVWVIAGTVVVLGIGILILMSRLGQVPTSTVVPIQASPTPTPTPVRILSEIASQSAFTTLLQTHASFSASLTATSLDDPSLSPPVLDLPLGFKQ